MLAFTEIGHTQKPKGVKGWIKLHVESQYIPDLVNARALFINLDGSNVPFLIEQVENASQITIKLDEVDTPQDASQLVNKTIFLDNEEVNYEAPPSDNPWPILNFKVINQDDIEKGIISTIESYPHQVIATIQSKNASFKVPIHEALIHDIDVENQTIKIEIVEGLEEL